jgi:SAM-dependent methyltransferase
VSVTEEQRDGLVERLFAATLGMSEVLTVYLGDTLGLYRALNQDGPMTAPQLASETGIFPRYAREWLEQQAAAGIVTVDDVSAEPDQRRYRFPTGHAEPLLDPESPYWIAAFCKSFVAIAGVMPELVSAFRSGGPVPWDAYGRDMIEAQGDFNRWWLVGSFGTEYLPSIPDLHERLSNGAKVADVACGVGWAAISLARAYPNITVDGFDLDEYSIEIARRNAAEAGVADRVTFETRDAADRDHRQRVRDTDYDGEDEQGAQGGQEHDRLEPEALPDRGDDDRWKRRRRVVQPRLAGQAEETDDGIDDAVVCIHELPDGGDHHERGHGRQEEGRPEQSSKAEPVVEQERRPEPQNGPDGHAHDHEEDGVLEGSLEARTGQDVHVILEPDELGRLDPVVVGQAPVHRHDHRDDQEDDRRDERGGDQQIAC